MFGLAKRKPDELDRVDLSSVAFELIPIKASSLTGLFSRIAISSTKGVRANLDCDRGWAHIFSRCLLPEDSPDLGMKIVYPCIIKVSGELVVT